MAINPRVEGKQFEQIFQKIAKMRGYFARKMQLSAKYIGPGKLMAVKGELDFQLIHPDHGIAFLDCKTFMTDSFSFSQLSEHQVNLAMTLNRWNQRAGFLVHFRQGNLISFYNGYTIVAKGSRSSFKAEDGIILGTFPDMALERIYGKASK